MYEVHGGARLVARKPYGNERLLHIEVMDFPGKDKQLVGFDDRKYSGRGVGYAAWLYHEYLVGVTLGHVILGYFCYRISRSKPRGKQIGAYPILPQGGKGDSKGSFYVNFVVHKINEYYCFLLSNCASSWSSFLFQNRVYVATQVSRVAKCVGSMTMVTFLDFFIRLIKCALSSTFKCLVMAGADIL